MVWYSHVFQNFPQFIVMTSLVAQMVKRLPTMRETRVQALGRKDLLEKVMGTHSSILAPHPQKKRLKEVSGPTIFFSFEKLRTRIQTPQYFD